ncbi:MAG: DUF1801 domain-containing protein [Phycisphaerae bacterium]|nr:DUF1801 domain-containing protein [Gemmatimonadaceae bacterium]
MMARSTQPDVSTFIQMLEHSHKAEILAIRQIILQSDTSIMEAVKWNAPSFYTSEHFATMNLRDKQGVGVIMHFGAKKRADFKPKALITDPSGLLAWLADDRALVSFRDLGEIESKRDAYTALIREWIRYV